MPHHLLLLFRETHQSSDDRPASNRARYAGRCLSGHHDLPGCVQLWHCAYSRAGIGLHHPAQRLRADAARKPLVACFLHPFSLGGTHFNYLLARGSHRLYARGVADDPQPGSDLCLFRRIALWLDQLPLDGCAE